MEPHIRARFTPDTLAAVAQVVGVRPADLRAHDGFESVVHEVALPEGDLFVKSTWSERRTAAQIEAEHRFVQHLADAGVRVAQPVRLQGHAVVSIPAEGGSFHVSATRRAPGAQCPTGELTDAHFEQWGQLLGQMHRATNTPACRALMAKRPAWEEELGPLRAFALRDGVRAHYDELRRRLDALTRAPSVFGLIHTDVHAHNVHWVGTQPTVFDFDDCMGFWYVSDVAIVLYYALVSERGSDALQAEYARKLACLRRGYTREFRLPDEAWDTLPLFLDLREAVLLLVCERSIPVAARSERMGKLMADRRERILHGVSALGLRL